MLRLGRAAGDAHELVKLEHAALAARPALASLVEEGLARVVGTLLVAPVLAGFVHAAAAFALAGCVVGDGGVFGVALVLGRCGSARGRSARRLSGYGLAGDGRWEVGGVFFGLLLLGLLGFDFGFDVGVAGLLLGRGGSVVDGGVLALCAGRDGQELIEGQDAWFAAAVALLAFVENGDASCWCVSGIVSVDFFWVQRDWTDGGSCIALQGRRRSCRSRGARILRPWWRVCSRYSSWYCSSSVFGRNQSINQLAGDKTGSTSYVSRAVSNGRTRETGVSLR